MERYCFLFVYFVLKDLLIIFGKGSFDLMWYILYVGLYLYCLDKYECFEKNLILFSD